MELVSNMDYMDLQVQAGVAELGDAELLRYLDTHTDFGLSLDANICQGDSCFILSERTQLCITVKGLVCLELIT